MSGPFSSKAVANTIMTMARQRGICDISPMKLQKLIYYAHAWHLAFFGTPLIKEEVQAWKYGPVIQDIYHEFKEVGNDPVTTEANELVFENNKLHLIVPSLPKEDENINALMDEILRVYGPLTPIQLSNQSHAAGEPWKIIADKFQGELPRHIAIPNPLIEECFKRRLLASAS